MRIRIGSGLIALNLLVISLMLIIILVPFAESLDVLRIILALPLFALSPGYALVAVFLPREGTINPLERLTISVGFSIAILVLVVLILNNTIASITIENLVYSIAGLTFILSILAILRRLRTHHMDRFNLKGF